MFIALIIWAVKEVQNKSCFGIVNILKNTIL